MILVRDRLGSTIQTVRVCVPTWKPRETEWSVGLVSPYIRTLKVREAVNHSRTVPKLYYHDEKIEEAIALDQLWTVNHFLWLMATIIKEWLLANIMEQQSLADIDHSNTYKKLYV